MKIGKLLILILVVFAASIALAGCTPSGPCQFTGIKSLTAYRLPDPASDVFGTIPAGETHEVLARTTNGWIGFDPGVAQAGNTGLAHHPKILLNASLSPFCLASVDLVTLPDVLADMNPTPEPQVGEANMVITQVNISATILTENTFALVDVTVQNQGDAPSSGYDVILFPQYGNGPQNPGGQNAVPDLLPGDSHTITFTPGIIYSQPGTYTLRVLLTDDWYTPNGSTESTGNAGDFKDIAIRVILDLCNPFADKAVSMVLLNLPSDTRNLPLYLKNNEGAIPGLDPEQMNGDPLYEYSASLGEIQAYQCGLQGFPDRLYCMFHIPEGMGGTAHYFELRLPDCEDPVFTQANVLIPEVNCTKALGESACVVSGGTWKRPPTGGEEYCNCP